MPVFIGAIKSSTVQHGGSFNIPTFGSTLNAPAINQKFTTAQFNTGDFNPSMNISPIIDPDMADSPSSIFKGF